MTTRILYRAWRTVAPALLLAAANLLAAPNVSTLTGGPSALNSTYYGFVDGDNSTVVQFHTPIGMAMDSTGNYIFVADRDNNAIRVIDLAANETFTFTNEFTFTPGLINQPVGVALDAADNVYVLNRGNGNNGNIVELNYYAEIVGTNAVGLVNANAIAMDRTNNIYVTVGGNALVKISPGTPGVKSTVATVPIAGTALQGLVVMDDGRIAACDSGRNGILLIDPTSGVISTNTGFNGVGDYTGVNNRGATKATAKFNQPFGLAKAGNGVLIVSDYGNNRVKIVNSSGTVTNLYGVSSNLWYTGSGAYPGWFDGPVVVPDAVGDVEARLPNGVLFAGNDTVYVTEDYYHLIRRVTGANLPPIPPPPQPPPGAPTILTLVTNYGQVTLTWSLVASNLTYNVKRSPSSTGPFTILTNTAATSFTDTTALGGTTYYYVVSAIGAGGEGPNSLPVGARPPLSPVANPQIGYVDFPSTSTPIQYTSVFHPVSSLVLNNDALIVIVGAPGSQTFYEFGATPAIGSIADPTSASPSAPVGYQDGLFPNEVTQYTVAQTLPDLTIKAIGEKADGSPNSAIVQARIQFVTANPVVNGNNAAGFTVSDITTNAQMWYTIDGTDPTNSAPSFGPVTNGVGLSLNASASLVFKIRAFHNNNYQPSAVVTKSFSAGNYVPDSMTFGFAAGEASSDFTAAAGQFFYAPVTMSLVAGTKMYSLQFNLTVTNAGAKPGPAVTGDGFYFQSFLAKPIPGTTPIMYEWIPPLMYYPYAVNPPPPGQIVTYDKLPFVNLMFTNNNLLGVGWLERFNETNLYNTASQDLTTYSIAHDTLFKGGDGKVVVGGYGFRVPLTATAGQTYQIQIGRPSATSDGIGMPGSDVVIATPTNGIPGALQTVVVGQRKYVAGDCAPFRWFNAGDFGNTNLDNSDVMQVFQSAIYNLNYPPVHSDFFDSMDSCGYLYQDLGHGYLEIDTNTAFALNPLFGGNDTSINQIAFGDGVLDVCDVYVTFRRSLDPSLYWFSRFWTNGYLRAQILTNQAASFTNQGNSLLAQAAGGSAPQGLLTVNPTNMPSVNFSAGDAIAGAGQTVQIPVTAQIFGTYPLRVLMLNLSVEPLDGSPALTSPVQFTPNPALGQPAMTSSIGNDNYAATWLNSTIAGLSGSASVGTLTIRIPAGAPSTAAYAVHFDHASASPNGLAAFPNRTTSGLITLSDRSASSYNDGIPDSWRLRYFGTVYNLLSQASADADGDGVNNWQEYIAGTDPTDAKSYLHVATDQTMAQQSQDCVIHWPSITGKRYIIERAASLFGAGWTPVATNTGNGTDMEIHDTRGGNVRFYRVHVAP
jgi:hypothetical protein